jgi:lysylphosphatidylglycerol synthetase-like protein (DUF2156 family)
VPAQPETGTAGSTRARLRLVAALLLGLLTVLSLGLALRLYFVPPGNAVASALLGVVLAVVALAYGLLLRAVLRQSRVGHILAVVACALGAVLAMSDGMAWLDWTVLGVNAIAAAVLLGCVPRRPAA